MTPQAPAPETNTLGVECWPNRQWRRMNGGVGVILCAALWGATQPGEWLRIPVTCMVALILLLRVQTLFDMPKGQAVRVLALFGRWPVLRLKKISLASFQQVQCKYAKRSAPGRGSYWSIQLAGSDAESITIQSRKENPSTQAHHIIAESRALAGWLGLGFRLAGPL